MASAYSGQTALCHLSAPPPSSNDNGNGRTSAKKAEAGVLTASTSLASYVPPKCLWSSAKAGGGGGITVYKVSSLGKVQARRLALSADNRTILLSSSKLTSRIKSMKKLFKSTTSGDGDAAGGSPGTSGGEMGAFGVRKVDVGLLDYVQRGQHTSKFRLARSTSSPLPENHAGLAANLGEASPRTDALSLSLVYRPVSSGALFGGVIDATTQSGGANGTNSSSALETLDFIIPSEDDYQALITALDQLMVLYKRHRCHTPRDLLLLEHHWTGMGKSVDKPIHSNDWIGICIDRLGVPLSGESLLSLFEKHCEAIGVASDHGLKLGPSVLPLMEALRAESYAISTSADPFSEIWDASLSSPSARVGKENESKNKTPTEGDVMTTNTFLRFLQDEQREDASRSDDARSLFSKINAQRAIVGSKSSAAAEKASDEIMPKREHITKSVFTDYLMSDANDILDPKAGVFDKCDMTRPLSQYWINTSHKAYQGKHGYVNEADGAQPYIFALQRGCRCLEIDIWDGAGLHLESAVVRSKESPGSDVGLPVQEVLSAIRSFLLSVPYSYPIILSIENNCTMPYQEKFFDSLDKILGGEGMLYEPSKSLGGVGSLPSPEDLRGKVVLKSKRPSSEGNSSTVVLDDFDDNVDVGIDTPALLAHAVPDEEEEGNPDEEDGVVIGFDRIGTVLSNDEDVVQKSPQELYDIAHTDAEEAKATAKSVERKSIDLQVRMNESEKQADILSEQAGISRALFEEERLALINDSAQSPSNGTTKGESNAPTSIASPLSNLGAFTSEDGGDDWLNNVPIGKEISMIAERLGDRLGITSSVARDSDRHESLGRGTSAIAIPPVLSEEDGGIEVQDFLVDSINRDESVFVEADEKAAKAAAATANALANYQDKVKEHDEAENELYSIVQGSRDLATAAERAATEARVNHEHAQTAKQRVETVRQLLNNCKDQAKSAETVAGTAQTEAEISAQRAEEAEKRAARARARAGKDKMTAEAETKKEEEFGKEVMDHKARYEEASTNCKNARERLDATKVKLAEIEKEIKEIERSPAFQNEYGKATDEHPEDEEIVVSSGSILARHKTKIAEMKACLNQVKDATAVKTSEDNMRKQSKQKLEEVQEKVKAQTKVAASARRQADHSTSLAEQLAEYAEEEREAANMRKIALEKASACVEKSTSHGASVESQLAEAERAAEEATKLAEESRIKAESLSKESSGKKETVDTAELEARVDTLKVEKGKALLALEAAKAVQEKAEAEVSDYKKRLANNQEILERAKKDSAEAVDREARDKRLRISAFLAHCKAVELKGHAEHAKKEASEAVAHAAAKTAAERHAKDYLDKRIRVQPIHIPLEQATLLHSCKFRYWEKSLALPFWHMHSISELAMLDMTTRGGLETRQWKDFNNNSISRVFPTKTPRDENSSYLNPVLPWSLGCQMVSMNCLDRNDSILLNDGRFRENGSCGYVLKTVQSDDAAPSQRNLDDTCPDDEVHTPDYAREIKMKVLGGCNLPKPAGVPIESTNLCVFVTLFEGETDQKTEKKPQTHATSSVRGNTFNPVWDKHQVVNFEVERSSTAMMLFQVWNLSDNARDSLIAAAALPVSCLREGYRSVQLFDLDHTRRGAYSCASLLVHVHGRYILSRTEL